MKSAARFLFLTVSFLVAALIGAGDASACQCRHRMDDLSACRSFAKFDAVFIGTVTKIVPGDVTTSPMKPAVVALKTEQWFKGERAAVVEVRTVAASSMCGYTFVQGESYLVFASLDEGRLWTSGCGPTTKRSRAKRHLTYLEHPNRDRITRLDGLWRFAGGRSVTDSVTATGPSRATAATDDHGRFQFNDLPPGKYTLSFHPVDEGVSKPANQTLVLEEGACATVLAGSCPKVKGKGGDCPPPPRRMVCVSVRGITPLKGFLREHRIQWSRVQPEA